MGGREEKKKKKKKKSDGCNASVDLDLRTFAKFKHVNAGKHMKTNPRRTGPQQSPERTRSTPRLVNR
jgi:hypothetical protein